MHHCYEINSLSGVRYVSKKEEIETKIRMHSCVWPDVEENFFAVLLHKHICVRRYEWIN